MKNKTQKKKSLYTTENVVVSPPQDYPWRVLDSLIQDLDYLLTESEKTRLLAIVRCRDYEQYLSLSEEWGPQSIYLVGKSVAQVRAIYQVITLIKKFRFPSGHKLRTQNATKKFLEAEDACRAYNKEGIHLLQCCPDDRMINAATYARSFLEKLLGEELPSRGSLTEWSRHGPGANLDTKNGQTSLYDKYSNWPYSCTLAAFPEAQEAIEADERWLGALEDSYRKRYEIPKTAILNRNVFWSSVLEIVPGNRITFVPKNSQTDRSIAIEPCMNLYLQLGVDGFIRRRLKRWGIDIDSQLKNREMARVGSLNWESPDNFVTLDLAAASDSISTSICKYLLPASWYNYLMDLRSPSGDLKGSELRYAKISSMGNGFTFALETAIFASVIYGIQREFQGSYDSSKCSVYGDDIIVEKSISEKVVALLNLFGFGINVDKSFFEGPFRESCGADWYKGIAVRPVFLTSFPETVKCLWTDMNRLRRMFSLRFLEEESITESRLAKWIPPLFADFTGPVSDEDFDSYRHMPTHKGAVYNMCLWKYKRLVISPVPARGNEFLFRKLMHNLREGGLQTEQYARNNWRGAKLAATGSRFTITRQERVRVSASYSVADIWRTQYTET